MLARLLILSICTFLVASTVGVAQSDYDKALKLMEGGDPVAAREFALNALSKAPKDLKTLNLVAGIMLDLESNDSALTFAERAYQEDDDDPQANYQLAEALLAKESAKQAVDIMRKHMIKNPSVETHLYLTMALVATGAIAEAEIVATQAKNKFPKDPDSYIALGDLYFGYKPQPVYDLAKQNYEEAIKLSPNLVIAHFNLAQCYWKLANRESDKELGNALFQKSLDEWKKVTDLDPKNARAFFEQGKIQYLGKQYTQAVTSLKNYRTLRPVGTGEPLASWFLGKSLFELRKCDDAQTYLQDAANQIDSVRGQASMLMARCYTFAKDFKQSTERYAAARDAGVKFESTDLWYYGAGLIVVGDTNGALSILEEASAADPKQCSFMFRYGFILLQKRQNAKAVEIFKLRGQNCSDSLSAKTLTFMGNAYMADSNVAAAIEAYQQSAKLDSTSAYNLTNLADAYAAQGDNAKAIEILRTAGGLEKDKKGAEGAWVKLAGIYSQTKEWAQVKESAQRAIALNPDSIPGYLYMGVASQGLGDADAAKKYYREVLKRDPKNAFAKDNLGKLGG